MTQRLYEHDPYLRAFTAAVLRCQEGGQGWEVVLDRTAFYPEGGGQPGDRGTLGDAAVLDTRSRGDEVVHLCASPLLPGAEVRGSLDWDRRFDHMCQHSGEHIVSGLICARYRCDNVGFHLGAAEVVIDFNRPIPGEDLPEIELAANQVIWENRPFLVTHPAPEALAALDYRSKKELHGDVRIVECPGADRCACCGTHVCAAGEIGLIKLTSLRPLREGVRITLLAGRRAYDYVCMTAEQNHQISVLTSARPGETAAAVARLQEELAAARYRCVGLENQLFAGVAASLKGQGDVLLFREDLGPDALRRLCEAVTDTCGGRCALFSGADGEGYKYALGLRDGDLRPWLRELNTALNGRGGGKQPDFAQGSVRASRAEIAGFFAKN